MGLDRTDRRGSRPRPWVTLIVLTQQAVADRDEGLDLIRAKNARNLADFVNKINAAQKKSGELRDLISREHNGVSYVRRVEAKQSIYYLLRGSILVFSAQEEMLRRAIDREASLGVGELGAFGKHLGRLEESAAIHVMVNPRVFDPGFAAIAGKDAFVKGMNDYWKAVDAVDVSPVLRIRCPPRAAYPWRPEAVTACRTTFHDENDSAVSRLGLHTRNSPNRDSRPVGSIVDLWIAGRFFDT
jgi:hypothetical protein